MGAGGKEAFYNGRIANAIVEEINHYEGVMTLEDLKEHTSTIVEPISVDYKGKTIWEIPPNGLGVTTLMALNLLKGFDLRCK